jgi:hypothetical protein
MQAYNECDYIGAFTDKSLSTSSNTVYNLSSLYNIINLLPIDFVNRLSTNTADYQQHTNCSKLMHFIDITELCKHISERKEQNAVVAEVVLH